MNLVYMFYIYIFRNLYLVQWSGGSDSDSGDINSQKSRASDNRLHMFKASKSDMKMSNRLSSSLEELEDTSLAGKDVDVPPPHCQSYHSRASKKQSIFTADDQRRIFSEACPDLYKGSMTMMHELDARIAENLKKGFEEQVT